ncbi:transposable element Tcb2 transposase [Trichonephila clavipes]|nr:transposable element Tcb2 transposase [Trichonephila clavipes]
MFLSKKLSLAEQKYSSTEKECATIIFAVQKLKCYLDGHQKFAIQTDHNPLVWLEKNTETNRRLLRHLAEANLKSKRPFRTLPLTPEHWQLRLQWCQARSMWNVTDWQKVVFSDESRFVLGTDDNRVRVWRRPGEQYNSPHAVLRHTARTAGVMVWGAIAYDSWSTLILMRGTLTGQRYVDDILRPHVGPFLNGLPGAIFQQDNARPHTERVAQDFLRHFQTLT